MKQLINRLKQVAQRNRPGLVIFSGLAVLTGFAVFIPTRWATPGGFTNAHAWTPPTIPAITPNNGEVGFQANLSQSKIVQGDNGEKYLNLSIAVPELERKAIAREPIDMIVVLDRSGSMSGNNKMPYAKAAIRDLISRLGPNDRFALVSFDTTARIESDLVALTRASRAELFRVVENIRPGSSTNMSDGLEFGKRLLQAGADGRKRKVLLLSDGHANHGITTPAGLTHIISGITEHDAVVSTIGMGLGFNENLMSQLADHGMGYYSYLENLESLGVILAKDLDDTRRIYAKTSSIEIDLGHNARIVDVSGYPLEKVPGAETKYRIKTGQLLGGSTKSFMVTVTMPTTAVGEHSFGKVALNYDKDGKEAVITAPKTQLAYAVVPPSQRRAATASIDRKVFNKSWTKNNFGRMRKEYNHWLGKGDRDKAQAAISEYRSNVVKAEEKSGVALQSPDLDEELREMEGDLADAFTGSAPARATKQKRLQKKTHFKAQEDQRGSN